MHAVMGHSFCRYLHAASPSHASGRIFHSDMLCSGFGSRSNDRHILVSHTTYRSITHTAPNTCCHIQCILQAVTAQRVYGWQFPFPCLHRTSLHRLPTARNIAMRHASVLFMFVAWPLTHLSSLVTHTPQ